MTSLASTQTLEIRGPTGLRVTREGLPPVDTWRWVPRRKADLVCGLLAGIISHHEATQIYALSIEELARWTDLYQRFGLKGLMTTRATALRQAIRQGA